MATYTGSCHCGSVRFEIEAEIDHVPTPQELEQGIQPFDGWAVNVRCLNGVDVDSLPVKRIYGSRI